ncbi:FeoA family protein [Desulfuromonas thiophila]|uniref:FeoA family protein n=1 Tax=Desulfuromonas thiophila TaxID=57664 RepID=UPI0024A91820|nr:ferrous iron transport protein A [Desulfuromonas thiophila]
MTTEQLLSLDQAPFDQPLEVQAILAEPWRQQLGKMGFGRGCRIVRLDETLQAQTVRVRGKNGEVVLSAGMGLQTIVHLDGDGRRIPLIDMEPGQTGHLEGTTASADLAAALEQLGFHENDPIRLIRKLPPMDYLTLLEGQGLLRLSEGDAARILGRSGSQIRQFSLTSAEADFEVLQLLGCPRAIERLQRLGIWPDTRLRLLEVRSKRICRFSGDQQLMVTSQDGLHLHLPLEAGKQILVRRLTRPHQPRPSGSA